MMMLLQYQLCGRRAIMGSAVARLIHIKWLHCGSKEAFPSELELHCPGAALCVIDDIIRTTIANDAPRAGAERYKLSTYEQSRWLRKHGSSA